MSLVFLIVCSDRTQLSEYIFYWAEFQYRERLMLSGISVSKPLTFSNVRPAPAHTIGGERRKKLLDNIL